MRSAISGDPEETRRLEARGCEPFIGILEDQEKKVRVPMPLGGASPLNREHIEAAENVIELQRREPCHI